jgi:adenylate cyclase
MTDSAPPEDVSPPDQVAKPAASRWAKFWGQFKRFRWPIAVAAVVVLAIVALALFQLPTVWQTIVTIASVGAVLSGLAGYWTTYHAVKKGVPLAAPSTNAPVAASALSVMVLPFQNLTGDASQSYVADGLTASLTSDLSRIRDAFVVNAATAFAYRDKPVTAQQVGKDLGVHFVLHGGVQRNGTKIRINAQLADADTNAQLWAESFEGDQSDLFALQDQVTARIGNSIGREMVIVAARESETRKSSPKVSDLVLRARAIALKPRSLKNYQQMEDLYRQALKLEPNNPRVMVALAACLALQPDNFPSQMDEGTKEKKWVEGRDLAQKAKELDPDNPELYLPIGVYAFYHGDSAGARRAAERRLALKPKDPTAYVNLADVFIYEGEPRRAIDLLTQAIKLDPMHPLGFNFLMMGVAYFMLGDSDAAIEWFLRFLEKNPSFSRAHSLLAMAYANKGEDGKARSAATEALRLDPNTKLSTFDNQGASSPAYKKWHEGTLVPAWRKVGLPE